MPLKEYLRILWKQGWIVIVMAVLTAASAILFSRAQRPVYRSSIQLNMVPARMDLGLSESTRSLIRNYARNIVAHTTLQEVVDRTMQDMTPDMLRGRIRVSAIMEDFMIQVDVEDHDPVVAQYLAQSVGEVFVERVKIQMADQDKRDRVMVALKDPATPATLHFPRTRILALAGGVLGVLIGGLIVLGLEWLGSGIIRSAEELERAAEVSVLGAIPEA